MKGKYKFTLYNNWRRSGEFELFSIKWCHEVKFYGIVIFNFELIYAETWM